MFLVSDYSSWSTLILELVNWLEEREILVLVPKEYLQSKELSVHKDFKKLTAWAGDLDELASEVDLVVCLEGMDPC